MTTSVGWLIVLVGLAIVVIGVLVAVGALGWFGRLPGDLRFGGEHARVFIPITSMLLISLVLTLLVNVFRRFW